MYLRGDCLACNALQAADNPLTLAVRPVLNFNRALSSRLHVLRWQVRFLQDPNLLSRGDIVHELEFAKEEKESGRARAGIRCRRQSPIAGVFLYLHLFYSTIHLLEKRRSVAHIPE